MNIKNVYKNEKFKLGIEPFGFRSKEDKVTFSDDYIGKKIQKYTLTSEDVKIMNSKAKNFENTLEFKTCEFLKSCNDFRTKDDFMYYVLKILAESNECFNKVISILVILNCYDFTKLNFAIPKMSSEELEI